MSGRVLTGAITLIVLLGAAVFLFTVFEKKQKQYSLTDPNATVEVGLRTSNPDFSEGARMMDSGKFGEAITKFQSALEHTQDPAQEAVVMMHLAVSKEKNNLFADYAQAVPILKEIVRNQKYPAISRAYAAQELGLMSAVFVDPKLDDVIYADAPFNTMRVSGDNPMTWRNIFQYAASIYPLGASEAQVARWYSNKLIESDRETAPDKKLPPQIFAQYKQEVKDRLAVATRDIQRIKGNVSEAAYVPQALSLMALSVGRMQLLGETSYGDMKDLYTRALEGYQAIGASPYQDGFTRYNYAVLTAKLSTSTNSGASAILAPFYTTKNYSKSPVERFLKNAHANDDTYKNDYANIILLTKADSKFMEYLKTIGWQSSDFSKSKN